MNSFPRHCSAAAEAQPTPATKTQKWETLKIWEPAFLMEVMSNTTICSPAPSQNDSLLKTETDSCLHLETLQNRLRENLFLCLSMCKVCRRIQTWLRSLCYQTRKSSKDKASDSTEPPQLVSTQGGSTAPVAEVSSCLEHSCTQMPLVFKALSLLE